MKKGLLFTVLLTLSGYLSAQKLDAKAVPAGVRYELIRRYPNAGNATWEKRKGNYQATWKGYEGMINTARFTPGSAFIEMGSPFPVKLLPLAVKSYIQVHYKITILDAAKNVDKVGKLFYIVKISGDREVVFNNNGRFIKTR